MILATTIDFFENLAQYNYSDKYIDFHNDFEYEKLILSNDVLYLIFRCIKDKKLLCLRFIDVKITKINFFNSLQDSSLTIDTIYRGRFENKGKLLDVSDMGQAYFYIDFYEGQKLEFWAISIEVISLTDIHSDKISSLA